MTSAGGVWPSVAWHRAWECHTLRDVGSDALSPSPPWLQFGTRAGEGGKELVLPLPTPALTVTSKRNLYI